MKVAFSPKLITKRSTQLTNSEPSNQETNPKGLRMSALSKTNPLTLRKPKNVDSDSEDGAGNEFLADNEGFGTRRKDRNKRNKLKLDDYLDDSSDEGAFGAHTSEIQNRNTSANSRQVGKQGLDEGDDDDMFSDLEGEEQPKQLNDISSTRDNMLRNQATRKTEDAEYNSDDDDEAEGDNVRFLDAEGFQKQLQEDQANDEHRYDYSKKASGSRFDEQKIFLQSDGENDDDNDDDDDNGSQNGKQKEIKFTSFGLKEELKEGRFDENENFIRYESDEEKDQDEWLKEIRKSDIEKARKAEEMRLKQRSLQSKKIEPVEVQLGHLISFLTASETPMELLQRFSAESKKLKKLTKTKNNKERQNKDQQPKGGATAKDLEKLRIISENTSKITGLINGIMSKGGFDGIYDLTREELMRKYKNETGEDFKAPQTQQPSQSNQGVKRRLDELDTENNTNKIWEFQWVGNSRIYGPYSTKEIEIWKKTYFKNRVLVKKVHESEELFRHISEWSG